MLIQTYSNTHFNWIICNFRIDNCIRPLRKYSYGSILDEWTYFCVWFRTITVRTEIRMSNWPYQTNFNRDRVKLQNYDTFLFTIEAIHQFIASYLVALTVLSITLIAYFHSSSKINWTNWWRELLKRKRLVFFHSAFDSKYFYSRFFRSRIHLTSNRKMKPVCEVNTNERFRWIEIQRCRGIEAWASQYKFKPSTLESLCKFWQSKRFRALRTRNP